MFVQLSSTSPYICDVSLGPIEPADRMASAPSRQSMSYLEIRESLTKLQMTRTPLKLLAPDEIPVETHNTSSTIDNNPSRQASLQPVWYTEQSIMDDNGEQRNSSKSPHRHDPPRLILPTIQSTSPEVEDEVIVKEALYNQSSLMRKSSTFIIEQPPSLLNESEKENDYVAIMTSTQTTSVNPIRSTAEPTDESFRALEHLLGLGSTNPSVTMITTTQESPKSNHESLSLTMVTPTELINQTAASLHLSYAPHGGGSVPSSQNILLLPTIESITDPSMNSTVPPPFHVDNSDNEESSSMGGTVINQDSNITEDSFHFTDDEKQETPKDDTNTEDDSNFSFELNDFSNNTTNDPPNDSNHQSPIITIRQPTSADVAFRALTKSRISGRLSQTTKTESPLAKSNRDTLSPSQVHRSMVPRESDHNNQSSKEATVQHLPTKASQDYSSVELISLNEDDETDVDAPAGTTLNLTSSKDNEFISPPSAAEADRSASASSSCISYEQETPTPTDHKLPVLSREYTFNTPSNKMMRSSDRRRSIIANRRSRPYSIHATIPEQHTTPTEEEKESSSGDTSLSSFPSASLKPMLSILSTNPTAVSEGAPIILHKSLAGSASPSPIVTIRKSDNLSPRRSIKPFQSSTPSLKNKTLQIVSIGEQEQLSTVVPRKFSINTSTNDIQTSDQQQQVDISLQARAVSHEGIQTSPERRPCLVDFSTQTTPRLSNRYVQSIEQQTTPINKRSSSSCQTTPIVIPVQKASPIMQTTTGTSQLFIEEEEATPVHTKAVVHLRRNVRFQFTPSTDARLAAKEKLEEDLRSLDRQIIVTHIEQNPSDSEREEDTEDEIKIVTKTKKKTSASKKKKAISLLENDDSSEDIIESPVCHITQSAVALDEQPESNENEIKKKVLKRSCRTEKKISIPVETVVNDIAPSPTETKRINRKRPNPKSSSNSSPETISPIEPVSKRAKTTKITANKHTTRISSPEPPSTRSRSKTPVISTTTTEPPSTLKSSEKVIPLKASKKNYDENSSASTNKRKNLTCKTAKRRLHSVEQDEGLNTADEEETMVPSTELTRAQQEKIEALTVAELKTRLVTHGENITKAMRKADLVALLIQIETQLFRARINAEASEPSILPSNTTSRRTRRNK